MSYSTQKLYPSPADFPAPPMWLAWVEEWDHRLQGTGRGQVRHFPSLYKCKHYVGRGSGQWRTGWRIYEWDSAAEAYVQRFEGVAGDSRASNPLFTQRLTKDDNYRDVPELILDKTIASIMEAAK